MAEKVVDIRKKKGLGNISKVLVFMRPYYFRLYILLGLTVAKSVMIMIPPIVRMELVDRVFTQRDTSVFFVLGFLMVSVPTVSAFMGYLQTVGIGYLGQRFVFDIRSSLYEHFMHLSLRFFGKYSVGKLVYRLMGDSSIVQNMMTGQSVGVISDLVCSTFAIVATVAINWRLSIVLFFFVLIFVLNYKFTIQPLIEASKSTRRAYDRLSGGVQNRLVANMAVKTFGAEGRETGTFKEQSDTTMAYEKEQGITGNTFSMNVNLIYCLGYSVIFFLGCGMVLKGDMTYGEVTAFTSYSLQLLGPALRFSNLVSLLQQVAIATDRLFEIYDEKPEVKNDPNPIPIPKMRGEVDFKNVEFHYEEGKSVLKDITIHCNPCDTTALIGPTGCGKSTVLNLILRFYDITGGELLVDGHDIRKLDLHQFRKQFGIVLQEPLLFGVSIRDNIRYSRPMASDDEVIAAAKAAEIHDFVMTLKDGYDTLVGDFGIELSVGQKQRITIARAICADPAILIMDEATSSLDSDSEQAIQRAMDKVLAGRTSFVVAHRLSTIKNATQIILLDKGYIQEQGTHDELMAIPNGRYHELYTKHMGRGVIED